MSEQFKRLVEDAALILVYGCCAGLVLAFAVGAVRIALALT